MHNHTQTCQIWRPKNCSIEVRLAHIWRWKHQCCTAGGLGKADSVSCVAKNSCRKLPALLQIRSTGRALRPKCNAFLLFQIFHAVMTKLSAQYSYWQCMNLDRSSQKQTGWIGTAWWNHSRDSQALEISLHSQRACTTSSGCSWQTKTTHRVRWNSLNDCFDQNLPACLRQQLFLPPPEVFSKQPNEIKVLANPLTMNSQI